jgi:glucokinase
MIGAIDIGGTKVGIGLVDRDGAVLARNELLVEPLMAEGYAGIDRVAGTLAELAGAAGVRPRGIGIGCTGPVDPFTGMIGRADTIPAWNGANLVERFTARFGVPVAVENDCDACALAECLWGTGKDAERFIYVTVSTGIGAGIVLGGRLYRGAAGFHPELGHHVIDASGRPCYCGARGCWEALGSGPAIGAHYEDLSGSAGATAHYVCDRAAAGDACALEAVRRGARYLGIGLANLITMFAPDVIALGGGVMRSWTLLEPTVRETIHQNCALVPPENTLVTPAALGEDLALKGAARVWIHRYSEHS